MTVGAWVGFVIAALIFIIIGLSAGTLGDGKAVPVVVGLFVRNDR